MKNVILVMLVSLAAAGCSGFAQIRGYEVGNIYIKEVDGEKVEVKLIKLEEYEGKNIKITTSDGVEIETKNVTLPTVPFKF